jgi:4-hydroxy-tetrahydrodipicolinate synthase
VGIRKAAFHMRGIISSPHVRFPAPKLDQETLNELEDLVAFLGLNK